MLARLVTLLILGIIGYFTLKSYFRVPRRPSPRPDLRPRPPEDSEEMVVCAVCGAYVSESEALSAGGVNPPLYFCGEPCRRRWQEKK